MGSRKNKFTISGVEAPGWQGAETQEYLDIPSFRTVLASGSLHFTAFLGNSIIISAACEVISVFFASLAAYAVTRLSLPGKLFLMFLIIAMSIFPPASLVDYLFKPMTALGWINTYPARIHVFENRSNENGTQWSD